MRALFGLYAVAAYVVFLAAFLYAIGFVGNWLVPKTIDSGVPGDPLTTLLIDAALLGAFAIPHSVMARPGFKRWWTRFVPPPIERSTYVLVSSLLLFLLYTQWRPLPAPVWAIDAAGLAMVIHVICAMGWVIVLCSTFMISHIELFGLKQALEHSTRMHGAPTLVTRMLYRFVRHPIMLGFIVAFWAAPVMSQGHLLFAAMSTAYIFVGVLLEERDLVDVFGAVYRDYRARVPMIIPIGRQRR